MGQDAVQGNALAQLSLGSMYFRGLGISQDYKSSYIWCSVASSSGNATAISVRNLAAEKLSPEELSDAQEMAIEVFKRIKKN